MNAFLSIVAPVFLIIGLGAVSARMGFFRGEAQKTLSLYVFYCALPCYLFLAMTRVPPALIADTGYIAAYAISMAIAGSPGWFLARRVFRRDGSGSLLAAMGACYANSAYIGIPVIVMAFGQPGPIVMITLFQVIVVLTAVLAGIGIYQKHGVLSLRALREIPRAVLLNPIVWGSFLGILFALQGWQVPVILERGAQLLGDAAIPTALFALGLSLGDKRPPLPTGSRALVYALVFLKNVVHPAAAFLIGRYLFHLGEPWLAALTVIAALPSGMNTFVFAHRYDVFVAESGQVVFLSSAMSVFTLSGLLWLFGIG
ncbi:MAG: AEC family transporter [Pseudomonadota bacterium]